MKLIDTGKKIHGVREKHSICMCGLSDCICKVTVSFCGCINIWANEIQKAKFYPKPTDILFYDDSVDTITCKSCKKSMRKYIIRKLKNEVV